MHYSLKKSILITLYFYTCMIITRTPFRISFFGGGTDYPVWYREHGGAVLSATINKYCYVICRHLPPFFDCRYRIRYGKYEETQTIADIQHPSVRECLRYLNFEQGIEMQHNTDVPGMSGLGSSSAFTVGFLHALYALRDQEVSKERLALDAIHVEQKRIRENVGSQDQTAAAFGGLNKIIFGKNKEIAVWPLVLEPNRLSEFEQHLMLFFTGYPRNASEIAAEQIKNTPAKFEELIRMRAMVDEGIDILAGGNRPLDEFGKLLHENWMLKRGLTSKITTPVIDEIYEAGCAAGAWGGKLLGAGGGGFILFFVPPEKRKHLKARLRHLVHVPVRFDFSGSKVIYRMPHDE